MVDNHSDGDRGTVRRARAEESARPAGAEATPRVGPRPDERRPATPGLGTAPTGVPSTTTEPETAMPPESEPGSAAAWAVIGAVILAVGLISLPFFIFSIVVAVPLALVVLAIAAVLLAARRRTPRMRR